jgi:hypothetical protein
MFRVKKSKIRFSFSKSQKYDFHCQKVDVQGQKVDVQGQKCELQRREPD